MGEATRGRGRARGDVAAARGRHCHWEQERRSRGSPPGSPDAAAGPHLHSGRPAPRTVREQVSAVSSARFVGVSRNTHTRRGTTDPRSRQQSRGLHVAGTPGPRKLPGCPQAWLASRRDGETWSLPPEVRGGCRRLPRGLGRGGASGAGVGRVEASLHPAGRLLALGGTGAGWTSLGLRLLICKTGDCKMPCLRRAEHEAGSSSRPPLRRCLPLFLQLSNKEVFVTHLSQSLARSQPQGVAAVSVIAAARGSVMGHASLSAHRSSQGPEG